MVLFEESLCSPKWDIISLYSMFMETIAKSQQEQAQMVFNMVCGDFAQFLVYFLFLLFDEELNITYKAEKVALK